MPFASRKESATGLGAIGAAEELGGKRKMPTTGQQKPLEIVPLKDCRKSNLALKEII